MDLMKLQVARLQAVSSGKSSPRAGVCFVLAREILAGMDITCTCISKKFQLSSMRGSIESPPERRAERIQRARCFEIKSQYTIPKPNASLIYRHQFGTHDFKA
jgi:hypothetical protein